MILKCHILNNTASHSNVGEKEDEENVDDEEDPEEEEDPDNEDSVHENEISDDDDSEDSPISDNQGISLACSKESPLLSLKFLFFM